MTWPDAEVEVDEACVRRLLSDQFPDLCDLPTRLVAEGFDNYLWRLGDTHAARLPRRRLGVELIETELRWLAVAASRVTLRTPLPVLAGRPSSEFAWPWMIVSWIDGVAGDEVPDDVLAISATPLAQFLRELHVSAPADAPHNPWRSVSLASRSTDVSRRIAHLRGEIDVVRAWSLFERARDAPPWNGPATWLHGDLHLGNMIFRHGRLTGVVDFGDLCAGDPATDIAGALMSLPYDALDEFFATYECCDDSTLTRAIGWAVNFGTNMIALGRTSRPASSRIGRRALENAARLSTRAH